MYNIIFLFCIAACIMGIQLGMQFWRTQRAKTWFLRGIAALENRDYTLAVKTFKKASALAPQGMQARIFLATALMHSDQEEKALEQITLIEALHPNEAQAWALICTFYMTNLPQRRDAILEAFARVRELDDQVAEELLGHQQFRNFLVEEPVTDA